MSLTPAQVEALRRKSKHEALERKLASDITLTGLPEPVREHRFAACVGRRYRFDFCWVDLMLAVEVEGGEWVGGRHTRPVGFSEDAAKYNLAVELGYRVLRFTGSQVRSGKAIATIERVITSRPEGPWSR